MCFFIIFSLCSKPLKRPASGKLMRMAETMEGKHLKFGGKQPRKCFLPQKIVADEEEDSGEAPTAKAVAPAEEEEAAAADREPVSHFRSLPLLRV